MEEIGTTEIETEQPDGQVEDTGTIIDDGTEEQTGEQYTEQDAATEEPGKDINQDAVNKRINKIHFQKKEAERKAEDERQKRIELEQKLAELNKASAPVIPSLPDPFDDDYKKKLSDRDAAIMARAKYDYDQVLSANRQQQETQQAAKTRQQTVRDNVDSFNAKSKTLGLDEQLITKSSERVAQYVTNPDVAMFLLADENGPLNVQYLAENPVEMDKISKMPATQAAVYIATKITPMAVKLKPGTTKTPAPMYVPGGRGKSTAESEHLTGVTFE